MRRSARDYLVYFLTMTFVTALMFAFNSLIFTEDIEKMFGVAGIMAALVGLVGETESGIRDLSSDRDEEEGDRPSVYP